MERYYNYQLGNDFNQYVRVWVCNRLCKCVHPAKNRPDKLQNVRARKSSTWGKWKSARESWVWKRVGRGLNLKFKTSPAVLLHRTLDIVTWPAACLCGQKKYAKFNLGKHRGLHSVCSTVFKCTVLHSGSTALYCAPLCRIDRLRWDGRGFVELDIDNFWVIQPMFGVGKVFLVYNYVTVAWVWMTTMTIMSRGAWCHHILRTHLPGHDLWCAMPHLGPRRHGPRQNKALASGGSFSVSKLFTSPWILNLFAFTIQTLILSNPVSTLFACLQVDDFCFTTV